MTAAVVTDRPVTLARVVRSEWTKLRSLRSTGLALVSFAGLTVAFGVLMASGYEPGDETAADPVHFVLYGLNVTELVIVALGASLTASEYASGTARATFVAVPRRLPVLAAKALVLAGVVSTLGLATVVVTFLAAQPLLAGTEAALSVTDPTVIRALAGAVAQLAFVGLVGVALGSLLRSLPAALGTYVGVSLVTGLAGLLPGAWRGRVEPYLPDHAAYALMSISGDASRLSPGAALVVLCAWLAGVLGTAAVQLVRRDV